MYIKGSSRRHFCAFLSASSRVHMHLAGELNGKTFARFEVFKGLFLLLAQPQKIKEQE